MTYRGRTEPMWVPHKVRRLRRGEWKPPKRGRAPQAVRTDDESMQTVHQQLSTGKVHRTKTCGVARRTRYGTVAREVDAETLATLPKCGRCWKEQA